MNIEKLQKKNNSPDNGIFTLLIAENTLWIKVFLSLEYLRLRKKKVITIKNKKKNT